MQRLDFRSDTVSHPTPEMRQAMADAEVGDDVYGEDPTVNRLEALAAKQLGKEAGLFVASGTMGNLIAVLNHTQPGDEAILGRESHVFQWEAGGMAALGGVMPHTVPTDENGRMDPAAIEAAVRDADDPHHPRTRLIVVENSFGGRGGVPIDADYFRQVHAIAHRHGLAVHLDGARLFNAAIALNVSADALVQDVHSVSFCLSKGLCAPVGSVLCGPGSWIEGARRVRKMLGGGMRQAGVLAAAGIVALERMVDRLADDHANATRLAEALGTIPGIRIDPAGVHTNIVHFEIDRGTGLEPGDVARRLRDEAGILVSEYPPAYLRAVLHYWLDGEAVDRLAAALRRIL